MPRRSELVRATERLYRAIDDAMEGRRPADVAALASLSRSYVDSVIHRKNGSYSRERLTRMLDVLGLDIDDFDHDPPASVRPQAWVLPRDFDRVDIEDRLVVERILGWMLIVNRRAREKFTAEIRRRQRHEENGSDG